MGPMLRFYFVFVFNTYLSLAGNSGRTAAAGAALPIPTSACSILVCPNNGMAASVWIFKVLTNVDARDFTRGLYGHRKRVCTGN